MSQSAVSRIWRAFGLKPHLVETFKLSPDPLFVEKVRDVVGLYVNPPEELWCSASTRSPRSKRSIAPPRCSRCVRDCPSGAPTTTSEGGTTNLYAALDVASGHVIADMTERHRAIEFRRFLNLINRSVPEDLDVHLIVDNVSTHKTPEIQRWLLRHPRFHLHFTPTYSSWINLVERWFAELTHQMAPTWHPSVDQRARVSHQTLDRQLERRPKPFVWHKSADEILDTLAGYCERISDSGH